jgi:uncharacterized membrane protein YesL
MDKFFDSGNPVMRFLSRLVDLAILNIMTVIYAIPVVTAGAALTAMNYVLLHLYRRDETYVTRMFRKSFRDNLKQGIPLGLIVLFTAVITATDLWAMHASGSRMMTLMMIIITVIAGFLFVTFVYIFALQSRYENTVKGTIVNAFRLALANLPRTVVMMIIWIIWILVMVYLHRAALLAFLLYGFSLPGYLCTMLYEPVFVRLEEE